MRAISILMEYSRVKTLAKLGDKLEARAEDDTQEDLTAEDIVSRMERIDPTQKKAYVLHLLRWYLDGSMRYLEDAPKARKGLKLYAKFRNSLDVDLKKLSFSQFLDLGEELGGKMSRKDVHDAETQKFYDDGDADLYFEGEEIRVTVPHTMEASNYFGRGTRWCTTSEDEEDNMFNYYNDQGSLYIIEFKGKAEKWQFHFEAQQFMDARDETVDYKLVREASEVQDCFGHFFEDEALIGDCFKFIVNPTQEQVEMAVDENPRNILYLDERPSDTLIKAALRDRFLLGDLINKGFIDTPELIKYSYQRNPSTALKNLPQSQELVEIAISSGHYVWNDIHEKYRNARSARAFVEANSELFYVVEDFLSEEDFLSFLYKVEPRYALAGRRWYFLDDATLARYFEQMDKHDLHDFLTSGVLRPKLDKLSWNMKALIMRLDEHILYEIDYTNAPEYFRIEAVKTLPLVVQLIPNASPKVVAAAIQTDPCAIYHLINPKDGRRGVDVGPALVDLAVNTAVKKGDRNSFSVFNYIKDVATPRAIEVAKMRGMQWFLDAVEQGNSGDEPPPRRRTDI